MQILKTRAFSRLDIAADLTDSELVSAVCEMNAGLWRTQLDHAIKAGVLIEVEVKGDD